MFKHRLCSKTKTTLRSSDRRNLIKNILAKYPILSSSEVEDFFKPEEKVCKMEIIGKNQSKIIAYLVNLTPVFFEEKSEGILIPTVFTLWKFPNLLPVVTTWVQVWPKIENGADLMGPGIISRETREGQTVGSLMALNLSNNRAIIAVGQIVASEEEMVETNSRRKFLKIIHRYNDSLANLSKLTLPQLEPPECVTEANPSPNFDEENHLDPIDEVETVAEQLEQLEISIPEAMDQLLKHCLLKVIKTQLSGISLPILVSTFYKNYLLKATTQEIELKKSSYKKLGNFLQAMATNKLLTLVDNKNILSITKFNTSHSDVINFSLNENDLKMKSDESASKPPPNLIHYYEMNRKVLCLANDTNYKLRDILTEEQVRQLVINYIKNHNLAKGTKVEPDDALGYILETCENLPWNQVIEKVKSQMTPFYGTETSSHPLGMVILKGKAKNICLLVENRKYGKKVTLVKNLDVYGIDINEFAKICRKSIGSATTIDTKTDSHTLEIQGNQILPIYKLLTETYSLKKHQIRGLENAPKQPKSEKKEAKKSGNTNKPN